MEHQKEYRGGFAAPKPGKKKRRGLRLIVALCAVVVLLAALLGGLLLHIRGEEEKLESLAARVHAAQETAPESAPEQTPNPTPGSAEQTAPESTPGSAEQTAPEGAPASAQQTAPEGAPVGVRQTAPESTPTSAQQTAPEGTQEPAEAFTAPPEQLPLGTEAPEQTKPRTILRKYADCYAENTDMIGWLRIDGTKLDYPVMHTPEEPEKYLHTSFEGTVSYPGVPFLDAACSETSDNLIIYGHNMPSGTMFRALMGYDQKTYWQEHPTIHFDTLYEEQEFEVLAAFYDRVYAKTENVFKFYQFIDAKDAADYDNAIAQFQKKSLYDTGVEAHYGDQLITLVTCAYHMENGRFVVVARKK